MGRRWSYPELGHYDSNRNEIRANLTITGINGINVAYDKENDVFLVNERGELVRTGFNTLKEAQHYADPEFTKNPKAPAPRKTHLMIDYSHNIYTLRKNNGDVIQEYTDANIMFSRIKFNNQKKTVVIKMTIGPK